MYGYPASHYNIPMEAVERIELVRGTGSLQYGAQFGGMLNYISKQPETTKTLTFESIILDKQYFTKRPQFYPGPGIWPSDGRTFSGTVTIKI
jgi:outer membrane receptor protein involved in Fe transport